MKTSEPSLLSKRQLNINYTDTSDVKDVINTNTLLLKTTMH